MAEWRNVGLNYINYSNICARLTRLALKPKLKLEAEKREETHIHFTPWAEGKPQRHLSTKPPVKK